MLALALLASLTTQINTPRWLEEPIIIGERTLFEALARRDAETLDRLLGDTFVLRGDPDVDRETWIDNALTLCWGHRFDVEALSVSVQDRTAVASFVVTSYRDPFTCEPVILRSLVTDVWVRRWGTWQLAVRHAGPAGAPGDDPKYVRQQFTKVPAPPPVWVGDAELSTVSKSGNSDTYTLGVGGSLTYTPPLWSTEVAASFIRSQSGGEESARTFDFDARQARRVSKRTELYGRGGYRRDRFAGIAHRVVANGGLAINAVQRSRHELRIDTGLGYLYENRLVGDTLGVPTATVVTEYQWRPHIRFVVANAGTMTLDLAEAADWRFRDVATLNTTLTSLLSLRLSHTLDYLNTPVEGFRKTDRVLSVALVVGFKH